MPIIYPVNKQVPYFTGLKPVLVFDMSINVEIGANSDIKKKI